MEIKEVVLPSINKFASDYMKGLPLVQDFFHYDLREVNVYEKRYYELMERPYNRKGLVETIELYMAKFGISKEVRFNLERLKDDDAVVVIGGQQAGLLTGPLYTIHKVISIIKLAKEQERMLQKPVIPVFWIAGEDHDIDEINHVFVEHDEVYKKKTYHSFLQSKLMVSDVELNQEMMDKWLEEVFLCLDETEYSNVLLDKLKSYVKAASSITDFFSYIINELFGHYGLLLVDSADKGFRGIQSEFFETLILQHQKINQAVRNQQEKIRNNGYASVIEMDSNNANLFYYDQSDRLLLEFDEEANLFKGKNSSLQFSKDDLLELARKQPENLSNNVVTRPMMQEHLFPVLAFISGPGEMAYWSELKQAFEQIQMKMPIIVPRMNLTIVEKKINKDLIDVDIDIYEALVQGTEQAKKRFLAVVADESINELYIKMEQQFSHNHQLFTEAAKMVDPSLAPLLKKNALIIQKQMQFINEKLQQSVEHKHQQTIKKYKRIENALRPLNGPQERTLNIYYFLNRYGQGFIDDLMDLDLVANPYHKIIML